MDYRKNRGLRMDRGLRMGRGRGTGVRKKNSFQVIELIIAQVPGSPHARYQQ